MRITNPTDLLKYHVTGAIERGESEAIMAEDTMRWYVLDPEGKTVTEVFVAGPYHTYRELEANHDVWGGMYETALLDSKKVDFHLSRDAALQEWLKDRSIHNPFQ